MNPSLDQPPCLVALLIARQSAYSSGEFAGDTSAAWSNALASLLALSLAESYDDHMGSGFVVAQSSKNLYGTVAHPEASALAAGGSYRFAYYAATCYLRIDWDEVLVRSTVTALHDGTGGTVVTDTVTTARSFTMPSISHGGYCLPAGFRGLSDWGPGMTTDADKVLISDTCVVAAVEPDAPHLSSTPPNDVDNNGQITYATVSAANLRWSFLPDYVPPTDGSANGFP